MYLQVLRLLERHAALFGEGRLAELAGAFTFPYPRQVEGDLVVLRGQDDLVEALGRHRGALLARGVRAVTPRIAAIELPRGGRFRAWVRWSHEHDDGTAQEGSEAIYYMRQRPDGGLALEMADYLRLSAPDAREAPLPRAASA